jgi:acyl-CoA thioesterase-1
MNRAPIRRKSRARAFLFTLALLLYGTAAAILHQTAPLRAEAGGENVLVVFGDSLTAGLGVAQQDAFPSQLEAALRTRAHKVRVLNAGVSGDTTAAGLSRLDWAIPAEADAVIVELGANDALRGLDPGQTRANLDEILTRLTEKNLPVLLTGMLAPRNMGREYAQAFDPIYSELAEKHGVLLYPFFLEGVTGERALNQPDGLHPNAKGVARIVDAILPAVEQLLAKVK